MILGSRGCLVGREGILSVKARVVPRKQRKASFILMSLQNRWDVLVPWSCSQEFVYEKGLAL